jgi:RimJ/RimL family protein N-acetyltransferase
LKIILPDVVLRQPEVRDADRLYRFRNDPDVVLLLGGFSTGYSEKDILEWIEFHRKKPGEVVWTIATAERDVCIGHVGLYNIDHRVRKAEFAIFIGHTQWLGRGVGRSVSEAVVGYGFSKFNLHRIELSLLAMNKPAFDLYRSLGFKLEGTLRDAQFRNGEYQDVLLMALLKDES